MKVMELLSWTNFQRAVSQETQFEVPNRSWDLPRRPVFSLLLSLKSSRNSTNRSLSNMKQMKLQKQNETKKVTLLSLTFQTVGYFIKP
jgi:hypothetical protein